MTPYVTKLPLLALTVAPSNPNRMEPEQFRLLVEAIRRVGFLQPILVRASDPDKNGGLTYDIVDGHHRVAAAGEAGLTEVDAVVVGEEVSELDARALSVGMNRMRGELNLSAVSTILDELSKEGWSTAAMTLTGFDEQEIENLIAAARMDHAEVSAQSASVVDEDEPEQKSGPYALEVLFADREDLKAAKRAIKKAAGKGGDMSQGLMRLLALEK